MTILFCNQMVSGLPCFQHTATKVGLFRDGRPNINVRLVEVDWISN